MQRRRRRRRRRRLSCRVGLSGSASMQHATSFQATVCGRAGAAERGSRQVEASIGQAIPPSCRPPRLPRTHPTGRNRRRCPRCSGSKACGRGGRAGLRPCFAAPVPRCPGRRAGGGCHSAAGAGRPACLTWQPDRRRDRAERGATPEGSERGARWRAPRLAQGRAASVACGALGRWVCLQDHSATAAAVTA